MVQKDSGTGSRSSNEAFRLPDAELKPRSLLRPLSFEGLAKPRNVKSLSRRATGPDLTKRTSINYSLAYMLVILTSYTLHCLYALRGLDSRRGRAVLGIHAAFGANMLLALAFSGSANAAETITYTYDAKGRLAEVERSGTVNNMVKAEYTHDKADNRKSVKITGATPS